MMHNIKKICSILTNRKEKVIMGSRWQDSGIEKERTRLSLDQFDALIHKRLTSITEVQLALSMVCGLFKEKGDIRPVQCRSAIEALYEMNKQVHEFCELLNEASFLPIVFTALRYRLLVTLYIIEEK